MGNLVGQSEGEQDESIPVPNGESTPVPKSTSSEEIVKRAEHIQGAVPTRSRYHRLPKQLQHDYNVTSNVLGTGCSGCVYEATLKESLGFTGGKYAVKDLKLRGATPEELLAVEEECTVFLSLDHPHIARLVDVYETTDRITLVMECMDGGELFDRITERKRYSEKDACAAAYQMLLAINYMHSNNIVHRDIKLENWLYESRESDHLKLVDFGFGRIWKRSDMKMMNSLGTLSYVAPEVLNKSYDSQCDMWSFGVVIFILLAGYLPFSGADERQKIARIRAGEVSWREDKWRTPSILAREFVEKLLRVDASARLTPNQALAHPWIQTRDELLGHRILALRCEENNIVCANVSGEEIFRMAKPMDMQLAVLRESMSRALGTHAAELEFYEQERRLSNLDLIQDLTSIVVRQSVRRSLDADIPVELVNDLCQFVQESQFRRTCMLAMAWSLTNEERTKLRGAFMKMDKNGDGSIALAEFKQVIENHFHLDDADVDSCFQAVDANHNAEIQYTEFLAAMVASRVHLHDDLVLKAFRKFDTDNSGYIDAANLKEVLGDNISMEDVTDMMQEVDANHDGKISYTEFIEYVRDSTAKEHHQLAAHSAIDNILTTHAETLMTVPSRSLNPKSS